MTCEIAVMNKFGIALAADSAVTVGEGQKIYHHAQKLFQLHRAIPVGIMIYGSAEIMAMPWEIVVRSYGQHIGERKLGTIEAYAQDFLRFTEASDALFPASLQREWYRNTVGCYWSDEILRPLTARLKKCSTKTRHETTAILTQILKRDHAIWRKYPAIEDRWATHGDRVIAEYGPELDEIEKELFGPHALSQELRHGLHTTARYMYSQRWFHPRDRSWIVFAGMGETESFPVLQAYQVGSIAANRLRSVKIDEARITREESAIVVPLAQSEMIDMFYRGIDPELDQKLNHIVTRSVSNAMSGKTDKLKPAQVRKIQNAFRKALEDEIDDKYKRPLMAAVDALPRHDLAKIAEVLVSLTAFRKRMSIEQRETVGGSIDVAILSKGEGFVWVKRNDPFRRTTVPDAASVVETIQAH